MKKNITKEAKTYRGANNRAKQIEKICMEQKVHSFIISTLLTLVVGVLMLSQIINLFTALLISCFYFANKSVGKNYNNILVSVNNKYCNLEQEI